MTLFLAAVALAALPGSANAYTYTGSAYNNASIADGVLGVCFENNSPVYTNRAILMLGLQQWGTAKNITLNSNGRCDNDGSNLLVQWHTEVICDEAFAWVHAPSSGTYSSIALFYNSDCGEAHFWWGGTNPVPNDRYDAYSLAIHEMGHAYGLGHTEWWILDAQVMEDGAPCIGNHGRVTSLADDDADGIRARYAGIGDTQAQFEGNHGCIG